MRILPHRSLVVALAAALVAPPLAAQVIVSPTAGVINAGGPGFGSLSSTFDQSGLSSGFSSGTTSFYGYLATNSTHSLSFGGNEWFSNDGTTSATVTYDLGSIMNVSALALWNEESSGIGRLDLTWSADGVSFMALALGLLPPDNPFGDYGATVFGFQSQDLRYVRFTMSQCPQQNPGSFDACAIGEVAFAASAMQSTVPEPATVSLMALGLFGVGAIARRRRSA